MKQSRFVYVIYIRTSKEKLWQALTDPDYTRKYWVNTQQESDWQIGSPWCIRFADGRVADSGKILEIDPPHKLVIEWRNEFIPEMHADGYSHMSYDLEQIGESVKLTLVHEIDLPNSQLIHGVANGWPQILSSLKSLLETGESLEATRDLPKELQLKG